MKFIDGSNTKEGYTYHELPGSKLPAQRLNLEERVKFILSKVNVDGKTVLDLGCNVGGISYLLAQAGGIVIGIDYDFEAIKLGSRNAADKVIKGSVEFAYEMINSELIRNLVNYDVIVWLSQWQWLVKQTSLEEGLYNLYQVSKKANTLVFESSASDGKAGIKDITQDTIYQWLIKNTVYSEVERYQKDDNWANRDLFICSKPVLDWRRHRGVVVRRWDKDWVEKINLLGRLHEGMLRGIKFLEELQDTPIVPRLGDVGRRSFKLSYEGAKAKKLREEDIKLIVDSLKKHKIIHRDIIPDNLLWNGKNVVLIDFAWAIHEGEKFDCPEHTGGKYRCPDGFNDEYSLRKIKEDLDEGRT